MDKVLLSVDEAAESLSVSRATLYRLFAAGALPSVTVGRSRRVQVKALNAFIRRLEIEANRPTTGSAQ